MTGPLTELVESIVALDHAVVELVVALRTPIATKLLTSVTGLGSAVAALAFLGVCRLAGLTDELRSAAPALAITGVVVLALMWTVQRPFPPDPVCLTDGSPTIATSLPSGHAAAVTVYAMTARRSSALPFGILAALALTVAVSRIYLGTHYFSDTVIGVLIGVSAFVLVESLRRRYDQEA